MQFKIDRRTLHSRQAPRLPHPRSLPAWAQDKPLMRMSACVLGQGHPRRDVQRMIIKDHLGRLPARALLHGDSLFKQGTELVALQRDNLEIGNIAPQDISKQMVRRGPS